MGQNKDIEYNETRNIPIDQLTRLYRENGWSSAEKPNELLNALIHSHSLVSAWDVQTLVGIGNAISDGYLVVYYPHLLILPSYQRRGIGKAIMDRLVRKYTHFHQHMIIADQDAVGFYKHCGFARAGSTEPMWIYQGGDH